MIRTLLLLPLLVYAGDTLDRRKTEKLIRVAEKQLYELRLNDPVEKKTDGEGNLIPNLVKDEDNALNKMTCTFKIYTIETEDDIIRKIKGQKKEQQESEGSVILTGLMKTELEDVYDYGKLYVLHGLPQMEFKERLEAARHIVHLALPEGSRLPDKMPSKFRAESTVTSVQWDKSDPLPVLIIEADFIKSNELKLKK